MKKISKQYPKGMIDSNWEEGYENGLSENSFPQQTGSRCQVYLKTYSMIRHANMKLGAKYQKTMIHSSWEKCYIFFICPLYVEIISSGQTGSMR